MRQRPGMRQGAWLALAAMLIQLVLSFGHMHAEDFFPPQGHGKLQWSAGNAVPGPGSRAPESLAFDVCAICASMQMVAATVLPEPVALALPSEFGSAAPPPEVALLLTAPPHLLFHIRAPPSA
jgi:hypothetical protein